MCEEKPKKRILVTGGFGFIGSHFIDRALLNYEIVNIDCETYAANPSRIDCLFNYVNYLANLKIDIRHAKKVKKAVDKWQPDYIVHFAAESHVDNSIANPGIFVETNVNGTHNLLEAARTAKKIPSFIHISTDEVYGSLNENDPAWTECSPYDPKSPYSASKAASDFLVLSYRHTYKLPAIVTHCTNNYGPGQHKEKMVPKIIDCIKNGKPIPVYGDGKNMRDWIHVKDHVDGILGIIQDSSRDSYNNLINWQPVVNFGSGRAISNMDLIHTITWAFRKLGHDVNPIIQFVEDRKGHDFKYELKSSSFVPRIILTRGILELVHGEVGGDMPAHLGKFGDF